MIYKFCLWYILWQHKRHIYGEKHFNRRLWLKGYNLKHIILENCNLYGSAFNGSKMNSCNWHFVEIDNVSIRNKIIVNTPKTQI